MTIPQTNYAALKQAMRDKGYAVSEGDIWRSVDAALYREFHYLMGLPSKILHYGLAYLHLLPDGHPAKSDVVEGVIADSAPQEQVEPVVQPLVQSTEGQDSGANAEGSQVNTNDAPAATGEEPAGNQESTEDQGTGEQEQPKPVEGEQTPPGDDVKEEVQEEPKDETKE